ncbi:transporter substrate-binding domain-containing protein [Pseudomonas sp. MAFF 301451]|nr:transporter substrate-binding domain-containing protein [Pseudomonas cyclaminis]MBE8600490.1 transporter substrate-binding domain-containing protein [Pseudomonas cyclaminis]
MRTWMAVLAVGMALNGAAQADSQVGTFQVLGRSHVDGYRAGLNEADWSWLRSKGVLILGDSNPDYAPLGMVSNDRDYEGVTADYAQLLSELLRVRVEVRRYATRAEVIDALKRAEVDFLGIANGYEAADASLLRSTAYAQDMPALVTRLGDSSGLPPDLAGKKIAMLYHYLSPEAVKAFYPKASLQLFPSTLSAIGAVAFGSADVYLGDALSANFLINKNYLNNVQLADFSQDRGQQLLVRHDRGQYADAARAQQCAGGNSGQ